MNVNAVTAVSYTSISTTTVVNKGKDIDFKDTYKSKKEYNAVEEQNVSPVVEKASPVTYKKGVGAYESSLDLASFNTTSGKV